MRCAPGPDRSDASRPLELCCACAFHVRARDLRADTQLLCIYYIQISIVIVYLAKLQFHTLYSSKDYKCERLTLELLTSTSVNCIFHSLEVFVMVDECRTLEAVGYGTSCFDTICHARWTTREYSYLWKQLVFNLQSIKELGEVRTTKVSYGPKPSEETAARQLLEVPLTDVL